MPNPPTPAQLGYRMPAEWEPHHSTWLTWPRPSGISFPDRYEAVPPLYAQLIRYLVQDEFVDINIWDDAMEQHVRQTLRNLQTPLDRVRFHHFPAYEPWCRDHGPIFLVRNQNGPHQRAIVDWDYNAWGGKYPPFDLDDAVPQHIARLRKLPLFTPGIVLEGGSIETNGLGTLLTTTACLLNPNRNPHLSKPQIEQALRDFLGVSRILWLEKGITGDDTDGHIDDLTRFVNPSTVVTVIEEDPTDPNYPLLQENLRLLKTFRDQNNQPLQIFQLPMPGPVQYQNQRLPASYANFYIANRRVLLPTFRHPNDQTALQLLQSLFPDRQVVGIDSTDLIWGLGSFHCITQQEPA